MTKKSKKESKIQAVLASAKKAFGEGAIMSLGQGGPVRSVAAVSSGSIGLDRALGVGGLPTGRLVEVYGPESSGKTTLALHAIAETQKNGGLCAFVDAEHALDVKYAGSLGVDPAELLVSQPDYGEQALEIVDHLVQSGAVGLVLVDSVAALVPKAELEGEMGDHHPGSQARMMSQAMRKLTGGAYRNDTTVLFINQIRQKIGVTYGSNLTTTGGNALKFYASVRLEVKRIGGIKDKEEFVGNKTRIRVVKNKLAPPFRQVECEILYGKGINREGEVLDLAVEASLVKKSGAWYSRGDQRLGQGRTAACAYLVGHPEERDELIKLCVAPPEADGQTALAA